MQPVWQANGMQSQHEVLEKRVLLLRRCTQTVKSKSDSAPKGILNNSFKFPSGSLAHHVPIRFSDFNCSQRMIVHTLKIPRCEFAGMRVSIRGNISSEKMAGPSGLSDAWWQAANASRPTEPAKLFAKLFAFLRARIRCFSKRSVAFSSRLSVHAPDQHTLQPLSILQQLGLLTPAD